jgi:hypothetical protein
MLIELGVGFADSQWMLIHDGYCGGGLSQECLDSGKEPLLIIDSVKLSGPEKTHQVRIILSTLLMRGAVICQELNEGRLAAARGAADENDRFKVS